MLPQEEMCFVQKLLKCMFGKNKEEANKENKKWKQEKKGEKRKKCVLHVDSKWKGTMKKIKKNEEGNVLFVELECHIEVLGEKWGAEPPNKAKHPLYLFFLVIFQTRAKLVKCSQRKITKSQIENKNGRNW